MGADWLNALEEVGGRLVPAARVFADWEGAPPRSAGTPGVRWLATRLEEFVDRETSDQEDDRFVEGAGAFLGLLLIEHFGGCARESDGHHRVQLGRFGWFDPFGAIQDALDAEDPRACLSAQLSTAEQEAFEQGPVSQVIGAFSRVLRGARPDLAIVSHFELTVDLDNGAAVDLSRLARIARDGDDSATTEAARRIVSMLPGADAETRIEWFEAAPRLLPRLVSAAFLSSLPAEQSLYTDGVGNDVRLALQLRYGARARYVRRAEIDSWTRQDTEARRRALENLAAKSRSLRLEPAAEGVLRVRQGDGLDGARLLLPDLAARLARVEDEPWLAAVPHRDVLLLAHATAVSELAEQAADAARRAPHPVSASLFAVTDRGPRPLPR